MKTIEELSQVREKAIAQLQAYDCRILVCSGTGCIATGSNHIHEIFEKLVKETPDVELVFSPCGGHHDEKEVGVTWVRKIPWRRECNTLQYSCLENPMTE